MLIDTHSHLTDEKFVDTEKVIETARNAGVEMVFVPTVDIKDARRAVSLCQKHQELRVMVGIHPENVDEVENTVTAIEELEILAKKEKVVIGIGEIGLDFFWDKEKRTEKKQRELFRAQMEMARRLKLPVAVHMREAETEMSEVIDELGELPRGQFHCFAGSEAFLEKVLKAGFFISFAGNLTYKSAGRLRQLLKKVPLGRLLLETDSPYLSPEPKRGTVNEPANVKILAEFVADELNLDTETVMKQTRKNALCLYSLDI